MQPYLIIGASNGIGKELAEQLIKSGKHVIGTYNATKPSVAKTNLELHQLNVMDDSICLDYLPDELAGFIYCPGSINLRPFERIKPSNFEMDYRLQVTGAIRILQRVLPKLNKSQNASVVLFSSVAVQKGLPYHSQVSASKGAIEGLTRALAAEYAPTIRVNCIAPSLTNTPLAATLLNTEQKIEANALRHPLKRIGKTEDIAAMAAFLVSENASWITGQVLNVDGGMSTLNT